MLNEQWKMRTRISVIVGLVGTTIAAQCLAQHESRFKSLSLSATDGHEYGYRLYVPASDSATAAKKWPLLIWFHGHGQRGSDNKQSLAWLSLVFAAADNAPPFLILVPQHPSDQSWSDFLPTVHAILERTLSYYPVDADRVYAAGVSGGGSACWDLISRYPESIAAAIPMSSGGGDLSQAARLENIPIWAFHCSVDTITPPQGVRDMVRAVQDAGGIAHLTETPNSGTTPHDCWTPAFKEYDVVPWMLAQHRGASLVYWRPGGLSPQMIFQLTCWLSLLLIVGLAWRKESRRRRLLKHERRVLEQTGKTVDQLFKTSPFLTSELQVKQCSIAPASEQSSCEGPCH